MKQVKMMGLAGLLAVALWLPQHSVARAEETTCTGSLGAITVDNLRVPQNRTCTLTGTRVQGTLIVENGATLRASRINVVGNIQAEGAAVVNVLSNSVVGGSIQIGQGGAARIDASRINGDLQFSANRQLVRATNNVIGGSLQAVQNQGGVTISRNTINGNLQCKENQPAPTGGNNTVQGVKEDQCARL